MTVPIIHLEEVDSTNAEARRRAEAGEGGPLWIAARAQSAGRGRRGREWTSDPGNLYATLLITWDGSAAEAAQLSFIAALAVWDVVAAYVGPRHVKVKWPNDVLVGPNKVSGILVESGKRPDGALWVAIGVGINVSHHPAGTERPATSIAAERAGPAPDAFEVLDGLALAFLDWIGKAREGGFPPIAAAWTERAYGLGELATARLPAETVEGIAEGLDADGALRLKLSDGTIRRITAGDVFFGGA